MSPRFNTGRSILALIGATVLGVVLLAAPAGASPGASPGVVDQQSHLPALADAIRSLSQPYSTWGAVITPSTVEQGALTLSYVSPRLGIRTDTSIYLPASYSDTGSASPVLYYLHGTVIPALENPALTAVTEHESLLNMTAVGGGEKQTQLVDFASQERRANFVVVAPDTDTTHVWCETCIWVNGQAPGDYIPGVSGQVVPAEDVLNKEIIPLVQHILNVRTDRGGRGITGFSMGGWSALVQAFRHPDMYSFIANMSGPYDVVDEPVVYALANALGYFRDQGYGTSLTDPVMWHNFNPRDLVQNWKGSGGTLLMSAGDVCLPPTDSEGAADCAKYPPLFNPAAAATEFALRHNIDLAVGQLAAAGVPAVQIRDSGIHGANEHRVYAENIVPMANVAFSRNTTLSPTFSYRTADRAFSVWGYSVAVDVARPVSLEMTDVDRQGRFLTLNGTGSVSVTTPPTFTPQARYRVVVSSATGVVTSSVQSANAAGRLAMMVNLSAPQFLDGSAGLAKITVQPAAG